MRYYLVIHRLAKRELRKAYLRYQSSSKRVAQRFQQAVEAAIDRIMKNPLQYAEYIHGSRAGPIRKYPFIIVYVVVKDEIQVVAVQHGKRRPGYWRKRLY